MAQLSNQYEAAIITAPLKHADHQPGSIFNITFTLSDNYEQVKIVIADQEQQYTLPCKSYNFTLYLLAKKHQEDRITFIDINEQGWIRIDDLLRVMEKELMHECDVYFLNLQIHRIRKQFRAINFGINDIIERRKSEIRMKPVPLSVKGPSYTLFRPVLNAFAASCK